MSESAGCPSRLDVQVGWMSQSAGCPSRLDVQSAGCPVGWMSSRLDVQSAGCLLAGCPSRLDVRVGWMSVGWMSSRLEVQSAGCPVGWMSSWLDVHRLDVFRLDVNRLDVRKSSFPHYWQLYYTSECAQFDPLASVKCRKDQRLTSMPNSLSLCICAVKLFKKVQFNIHAQSS